MVALQKYQNKKIAIYGMGITGCSVAKAFKKLNVEVFCWDDNKKVRRKGLIAALSSKYKNRSKENIVEGDYYEDDSNNLQIEAMLESNEYIDKYGRLLNEYGHVVTDLNGEAIYVDDDKMKYYTVKEYEV